MPAKIYSGSDSIMRNLFLIFLCIGLTLGASACTESTVEETRPVVRPVITYKVPDYVEGRIRTFTGTAKAAVETNLSFQVGGKIIEINVNVGDRIKKGDLLARLDDTDYRTKVRQMEAETARIHATLIESQASYDRIRKLYNKGITTKTELDTVKARYDANLALQRSSRQALELSRKQVAYTRLTAPMDGSVSEVRMEVHQVVQAGTVIAVLTAGGGLEMEIGVPERLIGEIKQGAKADVVFDAIPNQTYHAQVTEVGVAAQKSITFPVTLRLTVPKNKVKPGMTGEATFLFKAGAGDYRVLIPLECVVGAPGRKNHVWVVDPKTEIVSKRSVIIGNLTSEGVQIKEGIKPGEIVVSRGVHHIEDGMQVRLMKK